MMMMMHSGHYSDNLCQKLPGDEFPAEIWQITGTGLSTTSFSKLCFGFGNGNLVQKYLEDVIIPSH